MTNQPIFKYSDIDFSQKVLRELLLKSDNHIGSFYIYKAHLDLTNQ